MNKEDLKEIVKEFLSPYINAMVDYKKLCDEKDKEIERLKQLLEDEELCKEIAQGHRKEVQEREVRERKEKEDLQKRLNCLLEAHKICDEQNIDYATRIDKAIKFIKNTKVVSYEQDEVYLFKDIPEGYDLLNILQGSDGK